MEYVMEKESQPSLFNELRAWKRQEDLFLEVFKEPDLQDRDFQKMKLQEFDRLWNRYGQKVKSTDEIAFARIVRFQRIKLRKALYPGLTGRLRYFIASYFRPAIDGKKEVAMAVRADIPKFYTRDQEKEQEALGKAGPRVQQSHRNLPRYGQHYKQHPNHKPKKGPSL